MSIAAHVWHVLIVDFVVGMWKFAVLYFYKKRKGGSGYEIRHCCSDQHQAA